MSSKEPWGPSTPWKNSTAFFTYLRGCLRKAWSRHPTKLNLIKNKRYQIPNPNPKGKKLTVFGAECEMCGGEFPLSDIQVDHKIPAGQLNKTEDIQGFVERLLYVTEDDLRLVCVDCNSALAYSDKHGVSYEDACLIKLVLSLEKKKMLKDYIISQGETPKSNAEMRREQAFKLMKEETKNVDI